MIRCIYIHLSVVVLCMTAEASAASFRVSKAVFTETTAEFEFSAKINANESAVLTLTKPNSPEVIVKTLLPSLPVTIVKDPIETGADTIQITMAALKPTEATIRFSRPLVAEEFRIYHHLELRTGKVATIAWLIDRSASDSAWVNTDVVCQQQLGGFSFRINALNTGGTASFSPPESENTTLFVGRILDYLRTGEDALGTEVLKAYHVRKLTNNWPGAVRLLRGTFVVSDNGRLLYQRELPDGMPAKASIELYHDEAKEVVLKEPVPPRSDSMPIEVVSRTNDQLKLRQWRGRAIAVTNQSASEVKLRIGATSTQTITLEPAPSSEFVLFLRAVPLPATEAEVLLHIEDDELTRLFEVLNNVQISADMVINDVKNKYVEIVAARRARDDAKNRKESYGKSIEAATKAAAPENLLNRIRVAEGKAGAEENAAIELERELFQDLLMILYPASAKASEVTQ